MTDEGINASIDEGDRDNVDRMFGLCGTCGTPIIDDCQVCGAPQCCPRCCLEATADLLAERKGEPQ